MSSINGLLFVFNRRKPVCCCTSPPLRVTGIKLHYIRLLAGIRLVLSITAPANNPTEHRAQTHHYTDYFLHPLSCLLLSTHSFISPHLTTPFLYPLLSVSFHSLLFPISPSEPFTSPLPPFLLWEREESYFLSPWAQAVRQAHPAVPELSS